jgi:LPXTG-motif cell wall-anchored protein
MKKLAFTLAALLFTATFGMGAAATATSVYSPTLVKQFNTVSDGGFAVESIVPLNDSLAVVQLDNGDIWLTDGTTEGTTELNPLATEYGLSQWDFWSSSDRDRVVSDGNGTLYFWGIDSAAQGENGNIWAFDGEIFYKVTDINFVGTLSTLYYIDGQLYAWAGNPNSEEYMSLNQINTANGDVFEIAGGNECEGPMDDRTSVLQVNGKIVFSNDPLDNCNYRMLSWDPNNPLTPTVDLNLAEGADPDGFDASDSWVVFENEIYFSGETVDHGEELWATDGTLEGTRFVKDIFGGAGNSRPGDDGRLWFTEFQGELFFAADDPEADDEILYKTDGTTEGTVLALEGLIEPGTCIEYYGLVVGNQMFTDFGCEFYVFDGTTATLLTPNLENGYGMGWGARSVPVSFDNKVFFTYLTEDIEGESNSVWVTDGTAAGTYAVTDFAANAVGMENSFNLVQLGSRLLFGVSDYQEQGGTGEMALYAIDAQGQPSAPAASPNLAKTGSSNDLFIAAGSMAIIVGAAFLAISRRKRTA